MLFWLSLGVQGLYVAYTRLEGLVVLILGSLYMAVAHCLSPPKNRIPTADLVAEEVTRNLFGGEYHRKMGVSEN